MTLAYITNAFNINGKERIHSITRFFSRGAWINDIHGELTCHVHIKIPRIHTLTNFNISLDNIVFFFSVYYF